MSHGITEALHSHVSPSVRWCVRMSGWAASPVTCFSVRVCSCHLNFLLLPVDHLAVAPSFFGTVARPSIAACYRLGLSSSVWSVCPSATEKKRKEKRETIRACFCISTFYIMNSSVSSDPERLPRLLTCCHFPHRHFTFSFQHGVPFLPDYLVCSPCAPAVLHSAFLTSYLDLKLLFTEFPAFSLLDLFWLPYFYI